MKRLIISTTLFILASILIVLAFIIHTNVYLYIFGIGAFVITLLTLIWEVVEYIERER